jgi:hypothetical protein
MTLNNRPRPEPADLPSAVGKARRADSRVAHATPELTGRPAYALQVECLRRRHHGGHQFVRVEHVHVSDGGQVVIGNVTRQDPPRG